MSNIFTDTVTVYNYIKGQDGSEKWQRTVITGVMWSQEIRRNILDKGLVIEKSTAITFPIPGIMTDKEYMKPKQFKSLTDKEKEKYWTLDGSHRLDVVVLGECEADIGKDYKLSQLIKDCDDICTVSAVKDNTKKPLLKHIEVVGR